MKKNIRNINFRNLRFSIFIWRINGERERVVKYWKIQGPNVKGLQSREVKDYPIVKRREQMDHEKNFADRSTMELADILSKYLESPNADGWHCGKRTGNPWRTTANTLDCRWSTDAGGL